MNRRVFFRRSLLTTAALAIPGMAVGDPPEDPNDPFGPLDECTLPKYHFDHMTDAEKEEYNKASALLMGSAIIMAGTAAGIGLAAADGPLPFGEAAALWLGGALGWSVGWDLLHIAYDPPKPGYAQPVIAPTYDVKQLLGYEDLSQGDLGLAQASLDLHALLQAYLDALEYGLEAAEAGDQYWVDQHALAASGFAADAYERSPVLVDLAQRLRDALQYAVDHGHLKGTSTPDLGVLESVVADMDAVMLFAHDERPRTLSEVESDLVSGLDGDWNAVLRTLDQNILQLQGLVVTQCHPAGAPPAVPNPPDPANPPSQ